MKKEYLYMIIVALVFFLLNEIWANNRLVEFNELMTQTSNDYYAEIQKDQKLLENCKQGEQNGKTKKESK